MTPQPEPVRRRLHGDDGSVIAEMALVAPLLVILMLGVFEFGTVWRNKTILTSSLRSADRIESQGSTNALIDQIALGALYAGNSKLTNMTLVKVIVYDAANPLGEPTAPCLSRSSAGNSTKGIAGVCTIYSPGQVQAASTSSANFGCVNSASWDWNLCAGAAGVPSIRNNTMNGGPDYIGIYAEYSYDTITGLLPQNTITVKDQAVYRIEPAV